MNSHWLRFSSVVLIALGVFLGACQKQEKVNLNAQLSGLSGDADAKVSALAEISKLGPEAATAVSQIVPLLKDPDPVVRRTAAYTLGTIGPAAKVAVPDLKALLNTQDRDQLTAAANALAAIDPSSVQGLKIDNVSN